MYWEIKHAFTKHFISELTFNGEIKSCNDAFLNRIKR